MHNYTHTYLANELDVFSLNVPYHQDLHLGQKVQGHLIHSISKTRYKHNHYTYRTSSKNSAPFTE